MIKKLPIIFMLIVWMPKLFAKNGVKANDASNLVQHSFGFIENKGQFIDQNKQANAEVFYLLSNNNIHVQLKQNSFSYEYYKVLNTQQKLQTHQKTQFHPIPNTETTFGVHRIDISFLGSNPKPTIIAKEAATDYINFYNTQNNESEGIKQVHHYHKIIYENIYPNIDIEFIAGNAADEHGFKYNIIVHPGGKISDIKLQTAGVLSSRLNANNHLILETAYGFIDEQIPLSYELNSEGNTQNKEINYVAIATNTFGFGGLNLNSKNTLVIDPMPWSSYIGGTGEDRGIEVSTDNYTNIIVTGTTSSSYSLATSGAYQNNVAGNADAFITKYNANGLRLWSTYVGGTNQDNGNDIAVDQNNDIYITGNTFSASGIATSGAMQTSYNGGIDYGDAFLIKFSSLGARLWGTYFGSVNDEYSDGISIDINGNIFLCGFTNSATLSTPGAFQNNNNGSYDAFIAKFNNQGLKLWCTYYGNIYADYGFKISNDNNGNAIVIGYTNSSNGIATAGSFQSSFGGSGDAFILKLTSSGDRLWCTYLGGNNVDYASNVTCDKSGNILVAGTSSSTNGIASSGAFLSYKSSSMDADAFVAKFNAAGTRIWASYIGGPSDEGALGIASDQQNNIAITGYTYSTSNFTSSGAFMELFGGGDGDAYLIKFDSLGYRQWATYFGSDNIDQGNGVSFDLFGNIQITGVTSSTNGIASLNGSQQNYGGGNLDGFISNFTPSGGLLPIQGNTITGNQQICEGNIPSTINGSIVSGGNTAKQYVWLSSITGINNGFSPAPIPNNFINYSPNALQTNSWFKRVVISGEFRDTSAAIFISVLPKPNAGFTINSALQCLNGNLFEFIDTTKIKTGSYTKIWQLGNGNNDTSTENKINRSYAAVATYYIKLIATSSVGCKDSLTKIINIRPNPIAAFSVNNMTQCLNANSFTLNDTSYSPYRTLNRLWSFGDNTYASDASCTKVYQTAGNYSIKLVVSSVNGCSDSTSKLVQLIAQPKAGFTVNKLTQCINNNNFIFNDTSSTSNNSFNRIWTLNNSDYYSINTLNKSFTVSGNFPIKLKLVSNFGCSDSAEQFISVLPQPFANISLNSSAQCFIGNSFILNDFSNYPTGFKSRTWSFGDLSFRNEMSLTKTYKNPGLYTIKLVIYDNNNCKDSIEHQVVVMANPTKPVITAINNQTLQSSLCDNYTWYLNNNPIVNSNNSQLTITQNGNYAVKVDSSNGCSNTSDIFNAHRVGVPEVKTANGFIVFPNPAKNEIYLQSQAGFYKNDAIIELLDSKGVLVYKLNKTLLPNEPISIDLSLLEEGFYTLLIDKNPLKFIKVK